MKTCARCGVFKPLSEFYPNVKMAQGVRGMCKLCCKADVILWQKNNSKRVSDKTAKWGKAHRDVTRAAARRYTKNNLPKFAARNARRKAMKRQATPAWANKFFIEEIYDLAKRRTKATGIEWHVDHIVPLKHHLVQGLHCEANLQVIPAAQNNAKGNRYWPDMP